jgi:hypothetical protein
MISSMPEPCRDHAGTISNILLPFFQKGSIHRKKPMTDPFVLCRDVPRSCRDGNPREKKRDYWAVRQNIKYLRFLPEFISHP